MVLTKSTLLKFFAKNPFAYHEAPTSLLHAGVLVCIIEESDNLLVLFTERTTHLKNHAGQISFPGGKMEKGDKDLADTTLRETKEEIGLAREKINIIGQLDPVISTTGFWVRPFVALVSQPLELSLDPHEVAGVFTAPLDFLLDPLNHETRSIMYKGELKTVNVITYEDKKIWGMTANILVEMSQRLKT
jgi:8-oxo-dGTP pyrophosphatase MutT (NUDIX family)